MPTWNLERLRMLVAVDLVVLTVRDDQLQFLQIERGEEPFLGEAALPGGFIREGESAERAAERELMEETGLDGTRLHLEQLRTYTDPDRDPRSRVATVAYLSIAPNLPTPKASTDARYARWRPVSAVESGEVTLVFDHAEILRAGVERARAKLEYTTLATRFCDAEFTITDLRRVYEVVWGVRLDSRNFYRKVMHTEGFVAPTHKLRKAEPGRPAALFRAGCSGDLCPPMLRQSGRTPSQGSPAPG